MRVLDEKWTRKIECSDCGIPLEIEASDVVLLDKVYDYRPTLFIYGTKCPRCQCEIKLDTIPRKMRDSSDPEAKQ